VDGTANITGVAGAQASGSKSTRITGRSAGQVVTEKMKCDSGSSVPALSNRRLIAMPVKLT
jgi:hypothetical protein